MHALEALAFIINVDDFLTLDAQSLAIHIEVKIFIKEYLVFCTLIILSKKFLSFFLFKENVE